MKVKYPDLKLEYIPFKCVAVNMPHWDLHYRGSKGERLNLCCIADGCQGNPGIKLLRELVKTYNAGEKQLMKGRK